MKKIIQITLGGRNIAIEDTAYEKIRAYIDNLREHFKNEEGRDEIIADIESRYSELMSDKIRKGAPHITEADVEEMIASMGQPEDFDREENAGEEEHTAGTGFKEKRRLYRDANNKILGGVCSGIANWLNTDPTLVRVLFAIIALGGFGTGVFIYLVLWIVLPARNMNVYHGKRLFRNPDDRVLGGVAGGLGAYFNINPNHIRLVLSIPLILSILKSMHFWGWNDHFDLFPNLFFGSLTGTFILAYIVLWIILPEAKSPYEKMEMYGKTVDLNTIRENVQNTMGDVKERFQNVGKEMQDSARKFGQQAGTFASTRGREFGKEFGQAARRGGTGAGYVIGMIFKAIFIFIAGTIAISLFIAFLAFVFSGLAWAPINNFLWTSDQQQMWAWGTLLFFVGAPIVGILVYLIRMIFSIHTPGNYLNWMFGGLWVVGWVCLIMFVTSVSNDLKRDEQTETSVNISQPPNGKMFLTVTESGLEYKNDFRWMNRGDDMRGFSMTDDTLRLSTVNIKFEKSADSIFHVTLRKEAVGKTDEEAMSRIRKISYPISFKDSVLDLPSGYAIDKNSKYRFQNLTVLVQVPVGGKIQIDPSVRSKLNSGQITFNRNRGFVSGNWGDIGDFNRYRTNVEYTMDASGNLMKGNEIVATDSTRSGTSYSWGEPGSAASAKNPASESSKPYRYQDAISPNGAGGNSGTIAPPKDDDASKAALRKEMEQKERELQELRKKLGQ